MTLGLVLVLGGLLVLRLLILARAGLGFNPIWTPF